MRRLILVCLLAVSALPAATIAEKTAGTRKLDGYFPLYWDEKTGKMWLEIDKFDAEFLYHEALPAGLGSNDVGLDGGQSGAARIVKFERTGPKVLLIEPNYSYRAGSNDPYERLTVEQSFAQSALWGFQVEAEDGGRVLVDATSFFLRDVHNVTGTLQRSRQGTYRVDPARCAFYLPRTRIPTQLFMKLNDLRNARGADRMTL